MTPEEFIAKWQGRDLTERQASQTHFIDLCRVLGEPAPYDPGTDPDGYCFERGATKLTGGNGWADVWKRGCFGWEYKGPGKDLGQAYAQLQQYAVALENPPLLVVCDLGRFRIHTNWTNTVQQVYEIGLGELGDPEKRQLLKWVFSDPERLKPGKTRQALTEEAAERFATLARRLRERGHEPHQVAHFVNRLVFCMFAEDVGLLPGGMFMRMLEHAAARPGDFAELAGDLFRAMKDGGRVGFERVEWFNGGLFDSDQALPLEKEELQLLLGVARLDWSDIDPSILGTLFERGLDPDKRSQLGAHYTDREKIERIIGPVVLEPVRAEWEAVKQQLADQLRQAEAAKSPRAAKKARSTASELYAGFLERLRKIRVLDPACGSGNFLYLALLALKDLEHKANLDAEALGLGRQFPSVGPESVRGIEVNPYAAELARVTIWIGQIQWMLRHGFSLSKDPILKPLDQIECRDALLNEDGTEASWPEADFIVGNPPFLGDKKMIGVLGESYTEQLRSTFRGRVPGGADLVAYWFEKARLQLERGQASRAGLVATNSIRGGASRKVLDRMLETCGIFNAWSDEPWVVDGAAVRVSLVCFALKEILFVRPQVQLLDGRPVLEIYADLSGRTATGKVFNEAITESVKATDALTAEAIRGVNLTTAKRLPENRGIAFIGTQKNGPFDIPGDLACYWLRQPLNPNGRPNSDVIKRWANGKDITGHPSDRWIIDFGTDITEEEAALYELPFQYLVKHVREARQGKREKRASEKWWLMQRSRPKMRAALARLERYIATPRVSKHRLFVWMGAHVLPDTRLVVIARDDDTTFGILHSRFHEVWSLATCSWHGVGNDPTYNAHSCFETFPFPEGLTPNIPAKEYADDPRAKRIAQAAVDLNRLRARWLRPPDLFGTLSHPVPGFPDRLMPVDERGFDVLRKRTLTSLYNERPAWLLNAHRDLDAAVAAAYGWPADIGDEEVLAELLSLNLKRAAVRAEPAVRRK